MDLTRFGVQTSCPEVEQWWGLVTASLSILLAHCFIILLCSCWPSYELFQRWDQSFWSKTCICLESLNTKLQTRWSFSPSCHTTKRQNALFILVEINLCFRVGFIMPYLLEFLTMPAQVDKQYVTPLFGFVANTSYWVLNPLTLQTG